MGSGKWSEETQTESESKKKRTATNENEVKGIRFSRKREEMDDVD